jgi:hypothetical protein
MMKSSPLQLSKPKVSERTPETIERVSDWSSCGRRRYRLGRFWTSGPIACVIGLNPSVANEQIDDPTNRRLICLLCDLGFGGYWLVNLIAESTPYPHQLGRSSRRLSIANRQIIEHAICVSDQTILAWGAGGIRCGFRYRLVQSINEPQCFGCTKDGEPKHPLYLPKHSKLHGFRGYAH